MPRFGYGHGAPRPQRRGNAPPFVPSQLAGFEAWYDDSTLPGADQAVASWAPRVGTSAPTFAQATSNAQPQDRGAIYEAAARRGAYCDSNDGLDAGARGPFDYLHDRDGSTLVAVVVPRGTTNDQVILATRSVATPAPGRGVALVHNGASNTFTYYLSRGLPGAGGSAGSVVANGINGVNVVACRLKPTSTSIGVRVNGGTEVTASWSTPDARGDTSAFVPRIGSDPNSSAGAAYQFKGDVLALLVFSRTLSDAELAQVESYLSARYYGLAVTNDAAPLTPALSGVKDVMCVGDSITLGYNATNQQGFARVAKDLGPGVWNFIGPMTLGGVATDGQSGWQIRKYGATADGHSPRGGNAGTIDTVLATYDPDLIVMFPGVNALRQPDPWGRNHLRDLYELILDTRALKPNVRFVVPSLLRRVNAGQELEWIQLYNSGLGNVVAALRAQGVQVVARDWYSLLTDAQMTTSGGDGLHPGGDGTTSPTTGHGALGNDLHAALLLARG